MYVPDMYDMWKLHEDQKERELAKYPRCSECGSTITEDFCYYISGEYVCKDCIVEYYMVETPVED